MNLIKKYLVGFWALLVFVCISLFVDNFCSVSSDVKKVK